jgi:hypothetical protein
MTDANDLTAISNDFLHLCACRWDASW